MDHTNHSFAFGFYKAGECYHPSAPRHPDHGFNKLEIYKDSVLIVACSEDLLDNPQAEGGGFDPLVGIANPFDDISGF